MCVNSPRSGRRHLTRMLRMTCSIAALVCVVGSHVVLSQADDVGAKLKAVDRDGPSKQRVEQLIRQLGHPRYTERRAAAQELRQIGTDAFDLLQEATDDPDPEIAASAGYLLQKITVRWAQGDDSPAVRRLLSEYGEQSEKQRLRRVQSLAGLRDGEGLAALCRIARFERSELLSREAAVAVIQPVERVDSRRSVDADVIGRELGESGRIAARWLQQYRVQLGDPAASLAGWEQLIDSEQRLMEQGTEETDPAVVLGLLWNLADVYRQLGQQEQLMQVADRMVAIDALDAEQTTIGLLQWFVEQQSWDALDAFLDKYQQRLERNKRSLYLAALARAHQGKKELADALADKASKLATQEPLESVEIARELAVREQYEWSLREYESVIDSRPIGSHEAILARTFLAVMLHDHEEYQQAAETLEPLVEAIQKDGNVERLYKQIQRFHAHNRSADLLDREPLLARYHFYLACHHERQQDWQQQRKHLELAIAQDPTDADVVIAMYRFHDADDQWREDTRKRILKLCQVFQQQINEELDDPNAYNQWAWLVSNTEGDYEKAVRYSRRSLELLADSPDLDSTGARASFLDTLGRCHYAAGDYENAVKNQREAVRLIPHMQVMQRQLTLFEKTLAEQKEAGNAEAPPSS